MSDTYPKLTAWYDANRGTIPDNPEPPSPNLLPSSSFQEPRDIPRIQSTPVHSEVGYYNIDKPLQHPSKLPFTIEYIQLRGSGDKLTVGKEKVESLCYPGTENLSMELLRERLSLYSDLTIGNRFYLSPSPDQHIPIITEQGLQYAMETIAKGGHATAKLTVNPLLAPSSPGQSIGAFNRPGAVRQLRRRILIDDSP